MDRHQQRTPHGRHCCAWDGTSETAAATLRMLPRGVQENAVEPNNYFTPPPAEGEEHRENPPSRRAEGVAPHRFGPLSDGPPHRASPGRRPSPLWEHSSI